jgi:hypothetical protein
MPVTDPTKPHDRDEMLAKRRDGRKPKPLPGQEELERDAAKHAARVAAKMEALRARIIKQSDRETAAFIVARREGVTRLEKLACELLEAHPVPEAAPERGSIDDHVEAEWRELAHASRQLRPLLTALEQADARAPGFEKWSKGLKLRLEEAMITVGELCSFLRLHTIRQRKTGRKARPKAKSPFTLFIDSHPRASPEAIEIMLLNEARSGNGGWQFELSGDKLSIISTDRRECHLKISGIRAAVSKARKK